MMPLWTMARPSCETCGWALRSLGTPWVAQRVWAMPTLPRVGCCSMASSRARTLPTARKRVRPPEPLSTARPAESYPRYSKRRSPSIRMGTMFRSAIAATIPHMSKDPLSLGDGLLSRSSGDAQRGLVNGLEAAGCDNRRHNTDDHREQPGLPRARPGRQHDQREAANAENNGPMGQIDRKRQSAQSAEPPVLQECPHRRALHDPECEQRRPIYAHQVIRFGQG